CAAAAVAHRPHCSTDGSDATIGAGGDGGGGVIVMGGAGGSAGTVAGAVRPPRAAWTAPSANAVVGSPSGSDLAIPGAAAAARPNGMPAWALFPSAEVATNTPPCS